jgi:hypothetical protein
VQTSPGSECSERAVERIINKPNRKAVNQMRIRVTQKDIDEGVQGNSFHCPVARAVKREFEADKVWVREIIIVTKAGSRQTYVAPPAVEDFIESYDSAILEFESPKPFSFSLNRGIRRATPSVNVKERRKADQA